eukprot:TRINITY_DN38054_c0_g1_i1.p1 TRINITY_DN38054_c0_g1~~TRINITY_DN38054_c0_g1_i1.p1  ORF type:complete len:130 (-),score=27.35 TRINITY_DN38054_c0_g1_i1:11-400(-)
MKILVAEDNVVNQKVITRMLLHYGYQCVVANDGIEAIEQLKKERFDLIFMDIQMPRMGGLDACIHIRSNFPLDQQPQIIALTANVLQKEKEMCLQAGMNDFVSKPLDIKEIGRAVQQECRDRSRMPSSA